MRIAVLQFAPKLGEPEHNRQRAEALLDAAGLGSIPRKAIDLLVLPELAFSGYNFPSLTAISPYLERTAAGTSARWAARTASRLNCLVAVGYPETSSLPDVVPPRVQLDEADLALALPGQKSANFNALVVVGPTGIVHAHYRKTHLYYTDASWAAPSPAGFRTASLPLPAPFSTSSSLSAPIQAAFAICMDLNPRYFTAPWGAYEAASFVREARAPLLLASMAWLTHSPEEDGPDFATLAYWMDRLQPLLDQDFEAGKGTQGSPGETLVVIANRTGTEPGPCRACELDPARRSAQACVNESIAGSFPGAEPVVVNPEGATAGGDPQSGAEQEPTGAIISEEAHYAGSSVVFALGGGRARVFGVLERAEEGVLWVDTAESEVGSWRWGKKNDNKDEGDAEHAGAEAEDH